MHIRSVWLASIISLIISGLSTAAFGQKKVLFIPLDDRPPCLQFPVQMAKIADIELIAPPRPLLGVFTTYGQPDGIISWLKTQPLEQYDAAIISVDMLAYGGLVASRVHATPLADAQRRLEVIRWLRAAAPQLKIYGSSVIMRLAPTADNTNEAYREALAQWAEVAADPTEAAKTQALEQRIPAAALQDYKTARERNLAINRAAVALVKEGIVDYLIVSQDDAKPRGVHIQNREAIIQQIADNQLNERIAVQPGADEVSMLLLARAIADKNNFRPRIKAMYSSEAMANLEMPYEDRPLRQTVSFHIKATGGQEVPNGPADLIFYIFTSRSNEAEKQTAIKTVKELVQAKQKVILADVDPKGDVQGGDPSFTDALQKAGVFRKLYGYASWNTAGNTIGTALPHGFTYAAARKFCRRGRQQAQDWFMLNRLLDDYSYHSLVRPQAIQKIKANGWQPFRLTDAQTREVETFCLTNLQPIANRTAAWYFQKQTSKLPNLSLKLPWNRTFEAEIDFIVNKKQ